jgi:arsenite methyltransferase
MTTKADETRTDIRTVIRDHYGSIAARGASCSPTASPGCCGPTQPSYAATLGYSADDQQAAPDGADLGLGCGNPTAIAGLRAGETVLDLGSGAGFDCFLAARQVGPSGRVIGVDMTAEMIGRARANAAKIEASNVEFRLGEIEHLPVADGSVDAILSNCVVNLSPDKPAVFREAFRVLKPGGRLAISDVVATGAIPAALRTDDAALCGCVGNAAHVDEVRAMLAAAGFVDVEVAIAARSAEVVGSWMPGIEAFVASATITARRPAAGEACCGPACCT